MMFSTKAATEMRIPHVLIEPLKVMSTSAVEAIVQISPLASAINLFILDILSTRGCCGDGKNGRRCSD